MMKRKKKLGSFIDKPQSWEIRDRRKEHASKHRSIASVNKRSAKITKSVDHDRMEFIERARMERGLRWGGMPRKSKYYKMKAKVHNQTAQMIENGGMRYSHRHKDFMTKGQLRHNYAYNKGWEQSIKEGTFYPRRKVRLTVGHIIKITTKGK